MVEVATKKAENPVSLLPVLVIDKSKSSHILSSPPLSLSLSLSLLLEVAAVAQRLNLPKAVQSSPPLSIPGKLMVPRYTIKMSITARR